MDKITTHLGKLSGKVLLFGGVYSNLQALEALKDIAEREGISAENCICTGDIVGYCAQPEETVQYFKTWHAKSILGNVEIQLKQNAEDCGCDFKKGSRCDGLSQLWYPYAKSQLSEASIEFLKTLPDHIQFEYANKCITVVHGSYFNVSEFIFKSTAWKKKSPNFTATKSDIIVAGHCGLPFYEAHGQNLWLNPGVIGMPANDGHTEVWYAILEDHSNAFDFKFHRLTYNFKLTRELMQHAHLPKAYAKTIADGIWDNMEILPEPEQQQQGKPILL